MNYTTECYIKRVELTLTDNINSKTGEAWIFLEPISDWEVVVNGEKFIVFSMVGNNERTEGEKDIVGNAYLMKAKDQERISCVGLDKAILVLLKVNKVRVRVTLNIENSEKKVVKLELV